MTSKTNGISVLQIYNRQKLGHNKFYEIYRKKLLQNWHGT